MNQRRRKLKRRNVGPSIRARRGFRGLEHLEDRICMTVEATLSDDGDLIVSGVADGDVEIIALAEDSYQVHDNGVIVAVVEGVTDDLRVSVDAVPNDGDGENSQAISLDLGGNVVDRIAIRGSGEADFDVAISNGSAQSLEVRTESGDDQVQVADTVEISGGAHLQLGNGDNSLAVDGRVGMIAVRTGDGADAIRFSETSSVDHLFARLGDGDNSLVFEGEGGGISYRGGDGSDQLLLTEIALARSVTAHLGDGANVAAIAGEVEGRVVALAGDGADQLLIGEGATIGGSVVGMLGGGDDIMETEASSEIADNLLVALGEGDNTATLAGNVGGDVVVRSENATDEQRIEITGEVAGEVDSQPGVPASPEAGFPVGNGGRRGLRGRLGSLLGQGRRFRRNC